jgi:peptide-methionine (R)-S-oxide reductase
MNKRTGITLLVLTAVVAVLIAASVSDGSRDSGTQKKDPLSSQKDTTMKPIAEYLKDVYSKGMPKVVKTDAEWRAMLSPETYAITREAGTERAFCGAFYDHKKEGLYLCVCCELPLFASNAKFDSGTGWPSFFQPVRKDHVDEKTDLSYGMRRIEINCARCDSHLGHVFDDGPRPTGLRYCLNSESLTFVPGNIPATF